MAEDTEIITLATITLGIRYFLHLLDLLPPPI